jgi:hypothetical protein
MLLFANGDDTEERLAGLPEYNESDSYNYYPGRGKKYYHKECADRLIII